MCVFELERGEQKRKKWRSAERKEFEHPLEPICPPSLAANTVCSLSLSDMGTDKPCRHNVVFTHTHTGVAEKVDFLVVGSYPSTLKRFA